MRRFVLGWKLLGYERQFGGCIVTYADDLVICCRRGAEEALSAMRRLMQRLRLTVNEEKTHVCDVQDAHFDFLGYQFGRCYSERTGRAYLGTRPAKKSIKRLMQQIHEQTTRRMCMLEADMIVDGINRKVRGWANYFQLGPVSKAYRQIDRYTIRRLRQWLRWKHKIRYCGYGRFPAEYLQNTLGLVRLSVTTRNFPWATV